MEHDLDLTALEPGDVVGIRFRDRVRVIAIVETVSSSVARVRAVNGQYRMAFRTAGPTRPEIGNGVDWRDGALLNGPSRAGYRIAHVAPLPPSLDAAVRDVDRRMEGQTTRRMLEIWQDVSDTCAAALELMNAPAPAPGDQLEFPSMRM